jgi:hypothetical protein
MATTPMIGPDGSAALVPAEQVSNVLKAGGKVGIHMRAPSGEEAIVPTESAHIAMQNGATAVDPGALAAMSVPKPPVPPEMKKYSDMNPTETYQNPNAGHFGFPLNDEQGRAVAADTNIPVGAAKAAANTANNAGRLLQWFYNKVTPGKDVTVLKKDPEILKPAPNEQLGYGAEQAGEFLLPGGLTAKAGKALEGTALASKGVDAAEKLPLLTRAAIAAGKGAIEGASTGGVEALHGGDAGDVSKAAVAGAAGPMIVEPAMKTVQSVTKGLSDWLFPGNNPTSALFKGIKPNKITKVQFAENVDRAIPEVLAAEKTSGTPVTDAQSLLDNIKVAQKNVYAKVDAMLNKAQQPNLSRLALPPAKTEIPTGVQVSKGGPQGGTVDAASRYFEQPQGENFLMQRHMRSAPSPADTLPELADDLPQKPTGKLIAPDLIGPQNPQYLSGGAGNLKGKLSNPGVMLTSDPKVQASTLETLQKIANDPDHLASFSPAEQSTIKETISRLKQTVPTPGVKPYAIVDGDKAVAGAQKAVSGFSAPVSRSQAKDIAQLKKFYGGPTSLNDAEDRIQALNAKLESFYSSAGVDRARALKTDPVMAARAAIADSLRTQIDEKITNLVGPGTKDLKKTYGALAQMEKATRNAVPIAERAAPYGMPEQMGVGRGLYHTVKGGLTLNPAEAIGGASDVLMAGRMKQLNSRNGLIDAAFKTLRGGPKAPPVNLNGVGGLLGRSVAGTLSGLKKTGD